MEFTRYNARTITTPEAYMDELEKVRKLGYAMDNEEELSGVLCIGAPIFNYTYIEMTLYCTREYGNRNGNCFGYNHV